MKLVVQRVNKSSVKINNKVHGSINKGFLIYLGITHDDTIDSLDKYINKVLNLRVFEDNDGKMNLNINQVGGEILVISQFTLYANCKRGNRPSFTEAAKPDYANELYLEFIKRLSKNINVESGVFGADMQIESINDGPVTIILEDLN